MRLMSYGESPQISALEYKELFDLEQNPDKAKDYIKIIEKRTKRRRKKKNGTIH